MRVIDSSGWIEYFTNGPVADFYEPHITAPDILTPSIVLYEVYKLIRREGTEEQALIAAAQLQNTTIVELDASLALEAAEISLTHHLAMADAIVYATALRFEAELFTSDTDLKALPGVTYITNK